MNPARPDPTVTRLLVAGTAAAVLGAAALVAWATWSAPAFPLLGGGRGTWITTPDPVRTHAVAAPVERPRTVRFVREVVPDNPGAPVTLEVTALRSFEVRLNGAAIASSQPGNAEWKRPTPVRIAGLQPGSNRIEVAVRHRLGPPLLRIFAPDDASDWNSDERWQVEEMDRPALPARVADDTLRAAASLGAPTIWKLFAAHRDALIFFATLGAILSFALHGQARRVSPRLWAGLALGGVAAGWLVLLLYKTSQLPVYAGFDGPDHLAYVRFVSQNLALPLATDGPAMYHPPLFYIVTGALHRFWGEEPGALLRLVPWLSGLAQVALAFALARRLFPERPGVAALAALTAGLLPLNIYMSTYLSNEPLHAALTGCVLWLTVEVLVAGGWSRKHLLALGVALGAALLTKLTSLLLLPLLATFLGAKALLVEKGPARFREGARAAAWVALPAVLIAGGFYLRNWLELGRVAIGNWDVPGTRLQWWQYPGFHTWDYFLGFGEALRRPFFAGFHSFADGLYATFWTDSLLGGVATFGYRHPFWHYEWMSLVVWLALPATALGLAGVTWLFVSSLRGQDSGQRLARAFLVSSIGLYFFAVFFINLRLPFYAQAKSSYALAVIAPLAVALAYAFHAVQKSLTQPGRRFLLVLFHAWAATLVAALVLSFGA